MEDERFSEYYLDPNKRSTAYAVRVFFKDGSSTKEVSTSLSITKGWRKFGIAIIAKIVELAIDGRVPVDE